MTSLVPLPSSTRELGLYAAVALIVPGGSLIALSLWAFRRRGWLGGRIRAKQMENPTMRGALESNSRRYAALAEKLEAARRGLAAR